MLMTTSTVPPPGFRVNSSAWVKKYKDEIKEPDQADPSIFADAEDDVDIRTPSAGDASLRVSSDDSGITALATAAWDAARAGSATTTSSGVDRALSKEFSLGTISLGPVPSDTVQSKDMPQASLSDRRTSTIEFLKKMGLLESAKKSSDVLVQQSLGKSKSEEAPVQPPTTTSKRKRPQSPQSPQSPTSKKSESKESKKETHFWVDPKDIQEWDILSGRGGKSNHHAGNKRFRQVVGEMKAKYRTTNVKTDKTALSKAIVEYVHGYGGRFLKKEGSLYRSMTKTEARKKTSQALRETKELKWTL